jgi:hypothetical protein
VPAGCGLEAWPSVDAPGSDDVALSLDVSRAREPASPGSLGAGGSVVMLVQAETGSSPGAAAPAAARGGASRGLWCRAPRGGAGSSAAGEAGAGGGRRAARGARPGGGTPWWLQFRTLLWREVMSIMRNPMDVAGGAPCAGGWGLAVWTQGKTAVRWARGMLRSPAS